MFRGSETLSTKTNTQQSLPIIVTHDTKFQLLSNADILQRKGHIPPCDDKNNTDPIKIQCHFIQDMHDLAEYTTDQSEIKLLCIIKSV
jgi:hypothetical protein